ncbi:MAG: hypothetical protein AAFQ89_18135 [Cyanobacteria bacterium J06626_18]
MKQLLLSLLLLAIAAPAGAIPADLTQIEELSERHMEVPANAPVQEASDTPPVTTTDETPQSVCTSQGDIQVNEEAITFPELACHLQGLPDVHITLPDLSL